MQRRPLLQHPIVGRDTELSQLAAAVHEAESGRGALWLFVGEPGIGKSRLAEECERMAREAGFSCAWGRCWESGGAPAFWPWTQVVRALRRAQAPLDPGLAALLEGGRGDTESRFELFHAVGDWLAKASEERPLWICLEDLHAADPASLVLLESLVTPLCAARVMVVGTARDAAIASGESGRIFRRISRQARVLALPRLDEPGARILLSEALDRYDEELVAAAVEATGGLPLFLVELLRLARAAQPGVDPLELIPASVNGVLRHRLDGLSESGLNVLTHAALIGMDIDRPTLGDLLGAQPVEAALAEAERSSLVHERSPGEWRFSHALLRDVLVEGLGAERRRALHKTIARALGARQASESALAHHLYRAGELAAALEAGLGAARDCIARFAFEDALSHISEARRRGGNLPAETRARLAVEEGHALIGLGRVDEGQVACRVAAELALRAHQPELLARAALAYGSVFRFAAVDTQLVGLLERALDAIPEGDSPLRAELLARLAAARQPDLIPSRPIALARSAIAMAERVGDVAVQVASLRAGCSALVDLAHPRERFELNERHLHLALREGLRTDELLARQRLAVDCHELGDIPTARDHLDAIVRLTADRAHARHRWRVHAVRALEGLWTGELDGVREHIDAVRDLGEQCGDANARMTHVYQLARWVELTGDEEAVADVAEQLGQLFGASEAGIQLAAMTRARFLLQVGRVDDTLTSTTVAVNESTLALGDRTMIEAVAMWARATNNAELARRLLDKHEDEGKLNVNDGVIGMCWRAPMSLVLSFASEALGSLDEALAHASHAAAAARRGGGRPAAVQAHQQAARLATRLGRSDVAAHHDAEANTLRALMGFDVRLPWNEERRHAVAPATSLPTFTEEGDVWCVSWRGRSVRVNSTKGMTVLAALVSRPSTPVHVLELTQLGSAPEAVDRGDAGELVDATARSAYRARAAELQTELAEAQDHNDLGRVEKLRAELDALADELSRGTRLDGGGRRAPGAEERARQAIRKQIRTALGRLAEVDPELARYLERAVSTGRVCAFEP